ncbi:hypothetical protein BG003_006838 [Podila horticola]|nr:hypothetical protein BG003_006838 [Podila horticola]
MYDPPDVLYSEHNAATRSWHRDQQCDSVANFKAHVKGLVKVDITLPEDKLHHASLEDHLLMDNYLGSSQWWNALSRKIISSNLKESDFGLTRHKLEDIGVQ